MPGTADPKDMMPRGEPATRTLAMPADANPNGDIFGGWVLSQMDIAGGATAYVRAEGRVATVAVDAMSFLAPVLIGDWFSCYARIEHVGRSSIRVRIESFVRRRSGARSIKVTDGVFTYVAIDDEGRSRAVPPERPAD